MTQAASSPPVEPVCRAMSADTMKMPEPIIDPATIMVESNRPRPRTKPDDSVSVDTPVTPGDLTSDIGPLLSAYRGVSRRLPLRGIPGRVHQGLRHRSSRGPRPKNQLPRDKLPRRARE